jgi:GcrA cell cycle regulator
MSGQSPWTDIIVTELKQTWSEGRPAAEIARRLNVSKNSVIGKARRLGLPRRPSPIRYSEGERKQQIKACRPNKVSAELPLPSLKTTTAIQDCTPTQTLPGQTGKRGAIFRIDCCCWPIGDPGSSSFQFCEQPALPGKPYCQEHANRAYLRKHVNKVEAINSGSHAAPFSRPHGG